MKTRKASSHVFTIHVYLPFAQTTVVENSNVIVLKLGEAMLKWIKNGYQATLYIDGKYS